MVKIYLGARTEFKELSKDQRQQIDDIRASSWHMVAIAWQIYSTKFSVQLKHNNRDTNMKKIVLAALALFFAVNNAEAFNTFSHQTIAGLADRYLTDNAKREVKATLKPIW